MTLTYEYRQSHVWLDHLSADRDPNDYDLCGPHSSTLTVPVGWQLTDRRQPSFRRDLLAG